MAVRVVLADDQLLVRAGLRGLLDLDENIEVVGEAADGAQAVEVITRRRPDVALVDIRMPILDGVEVTRRVVGDPRLAGTRVLALTTFDLDEYIFGALRAGASGFLTKDVDPTDLRNAVHVVAAGEALLSPSITRRLISEFISTPPPTAEPADRLDILTDREREVMALVAGGLSNDEIGRRLFMSRETARTHVSRAMTKLDVRDRVQLVVLAYRTGLVRP